MGKILQVVSRSEMFSLLDSFLGYNQVLVSLEDQWKIVFIMKWGTYTYKNMSFTLINDEATFQRDMDIDFWVLINKLVVF